MCLGRTLCSKITVGLLWQRNKDQKVMIWFTFDNDKLADCSEVLGHYLGPGTFEESNIWSSKFCFEASSPSFLSFHLWGASSFLVHCCIPGLYNSGWNVISPLCIFSGWIKSIELIPLLFFDYSSFITCN